MPKSVRGVPHAHVTHGSPHERASARRAEIAFVVMSLVLITSLQILANSWTHGLALQMLLRELYYLPILYAAWRFGWRGGLATAAVSALLYLQHALFSLFLGGLWGAGGDNLYEILMFLVIGTLFGWFRDNAAARAHELRRISEKLEDAYHALEERTIQLANVREYTQSILRSITSGVMTVGPDGSVATVNSAAESVLGMTEDDMVPHKLGALFLDDGGISANLARVLDGRIPKIMSEVQCVTETGRAVRVVMSIARMRDVNGRLLGAVVAFEDVSEMRALVEHLIWADRLASMGELTAGVAHEVRNPLGIIRASVQLVEDSRDDPAKVSEATSVIKQEIDRLDRVIKALLDFGRPSTPTLRPSSIRDVIADVVLLVRRFAAQASVEIVAEYGAEVPLVVADADQMKQVLVNLISNAVQVMEPTGGTVTIRVWSDDGLVLFSVADTGPGIEEDELEKVFAPFHSTRADGTGLGLTIVHRIIDQHRGSIFVESMPGTGTTFTVALPAMPATGEDS